MKCNVQRGFSRLPVTALHTIQHDEITILLSSEGSSLRVYLPHLSAAYYTETIFTAQNIHGIAHGFPIQNHGVTRYPLLIWGGQHICVCLLVVDDEGSQDGVPATRFELGKAAQVSDWILTGAIGDQGDQAYFLTAHNALWATDMHTVSNAATFSIGQGIKTLLYSAAIVQLSESRLLVSSGTIFGEVIVWVCSRSASDSQWLVSTRHRFLGHKGSVFGVSMSNSFAYQNQKRQILASCSDDRTIRLWDISDCSEEDAETYGGDRQCDTTGFSVNDDQARQLTTAWGHASRIWNIHFASLEPTSEDCIQLVSSGEDGVCQMWDVDLNALFKPNTLSRDALWISHKDRFHAGKNIWSLNVSHGVRQTRIYTGGADGQIVSRLKPNGVTVTRQSLHFSKLTRHWQYCSARTLKQYLCFPDGTVIATTDTGCVVKSHVQNFDQYNHLYEGHHKRNTTLCANTMGGITFYCSADGSLGLYDNLKQTNLSSVLSFSSQAIWLQIAQMRTLDENVQMINLVVIHYGSSEPLFVSLRRDHDRLQATTQSIQLPIDFGITTSYYNHTYQMLLCGSRSGALAICPANISAEIVIRNSLVIRHLHGSDSITAIMDLTDFQIAQDLKNLYFLTTGRDGTFAIHCLEGEEPYSVLKTIHRGTLPLGPNIEGVYTLAPGTDAVSLTFFGFKAKDFIVWNETIQAQLLSIDCGGAHRSWHYSPNDISLEAGTFVWTKAGTFNSCHSKQLTHDIVQQGGHGREIKALAVSHVLESSTLNALKISGYRIVATGAEDTDIRLFKYASSCCTQIAVLKHHNTGLQELKFSSCNSYLFSSGGVEEFIVWKLSRVPLIEVGAVITAMLPKDSEDEDARIMDFDVSEPSLAVTADRKFMIFMAYSNGKAKLFEFNDSQNQTQEKFRLMREINAGSICLTQAHILPNDDSNSVLLGATDGFLRYYNVDHTNKLDISHRVHQNSIAAMSIQELAAKTYLILTGGDDNALALTILQVQGDQPVFKTVLVPRAHAAAVTSVALADAVDEAGNKTYFLISAGNDQMVKLWKISGLTLQIDSPEQNLVETGADCIERFIRLVKVSENPTDVADTSDMEVVGCVSDYPSLRIEVLVVGVGMQCIEFHLDSRDESMVT